MSRKRKVGETQDVAVVLPKLKLVRMQVLENKHETPSSSMTLR